VVDLDNHHVVIVVMVTVMLGYDCSGDGESNLVIVMVTDNHHVMIVMVMVV
jgi:hypothetical protein